MSQNVLLPIDADLVIRILHNGLRFPLVKLNIGKRIVSCIKMSAKQAFVYAVLTGHGYLDPSETDMMYILTKDMFRVFNQVGEYKIQNGIFLRTDMRFFSTPLLKARKKPYIRNMDKFIVPIEFSSYDSLLKQMADLAGQVASEGIDPSNFIVCPIRMFRAGVTQFESFFEFVVANYFGERGYITDTQIPFYYGVGTPDAAAYSIPTAMKVLREEGFFETGGTVIDLMLPGVFGTAKRTNDRTGVDEAIVFEVKVNQISAPQIQKYTERAVFNRAYEVIPCEKAPESYAGLFTVSTDGGIVIKEGTKAVPFSRNIQAAYFKWFQDYLKFYIISNLDNDELEKVLHSVGVSLAHEEIMHWVETTSIKGIATLIRRTIELR